MNPRAVWYGSDNERITELRDYFAAHAPEMPESYEKSVRLREHSKAIKHDTYMEKGYLDILCQWRYEYADTMIKAREAK